MNFQVELEQRVNEINSVINEFLPKEEGFQKVIFEAMNYSVQAGGKRLRPMLISETCKLFGEQSDCVKHFMAAMEMIHTYSLVHDDLPCMDNDMYRGGQLTTHAKYGEDLGVLAGDALLNYAYETIAKAMVHSSDPAKAAKAFQILSTKAGVYGMVGGQVVDVQSEKSETEVISREKLDFIYKLKTGALIEASMLIGAVLGGASDADLQTVEEIAAKIGLAFQIQDDILDVTSTLEELGKPIGSDEKNNKPTYVTFEGLEKAQKDVEDLSRQGIELLHGLNGNVDFLDGLFDYLIHRNK